MIPPSDQPTRWTGSSPASCGDLAHGRRDDLVDPVLEPEVLVGEGDLAVVDQVGRVPAPDEVLDERAAAAQVEADRRGGERRHEQDRRPGQLAAPRRRVVAAQRALRPLVDDRRGHAAQVGEMPADDAVPDVRRGVGERLGARNGRDQVHRTPEASGRPGARRRPAASSSSRANSSARSICGQCPQPSSRASRAPGTDSSNRCAPEEKTIRSCEPQTTSSGAVIPSSANGSRSSGISRRPVAR